VSRLFVVFRAAGLRFSQDGCAFLAQAVAFNALFSVFPILILTVAAFGFVYGTDEAQARALALIGTLAPSVQPTLTENVRHAVAFRGVSGAVALVALLWSSKNLFQALAYALDRALGVTQGRPLFKDILVSITLIPVLGLLLLVATAVPLVISFVVEYGGFRHAVVWTQVAGYGTAVLLVFVVTVLLYDYLPNREVRVGFGIPGAIVSTLGYELAQIAFAVYSTHVDFRHVYGALSAVAILLLWFYYMGYIFLFGAELSAQWLEQHERAKGTGKALEARRSA
jgi:membrane protein